jgi:hypothetical protein
VAGQGDVPGVYTVPVDDGGNPPRRRLRRAAPLPDPVRGSATMPTSGAVVTAVVPKIWQVIEDTQESTPKGAAHWSRAWMAAQRSFRQEVGVPAAGRIGRVHGRRAGEAWCEHR